MADSGTGEHFNFFAALMTISGRVFMVRNRDLLPTAVAAFDKGAGGKRTLLLDAGFTSWKIKRSVLPKHRPGGAS